MRHENLFRVAGRGKYPWLNCDGVQALSLETRGHCPVTSFSRARYLCPEGRCTGALAASRQPGSRALLCMAHGEYKRKMTLDEQHD